MTLQVTVILSIMRWALNLADGCVDGYLLLSALFSSSCALIDAAARKIVNEHLVRIGVSTATVLTGRIV